MLKGKEIAEELQQLAPGLELPPQYPGNVTTGYFQLMEKLLVQKAKQLDEIAAQSEVLDELVDISPILAEVPSKCPFTAPGSYFESFPTQIKELRKAKSAKIIPLSKKVKLYKRCIAAAAVAAVISIGAVMMAKHYNKFAIDRQLANISDEEIEEYLLTHTDAFDKAQLMSSVKAEELPNILPEELSNLELETYLEENIIGEVPFNPSKK
ncbi:hypothetical protein LX64_03012 [Chitinophaga skermanii]|uniref:Uncharacterized protein n=1 Tax=Chitinophaga skermanii TaxID=331697 RepID=A0A327QKA7_9BACT|nr:hypothetical protein [Chitinophaga skermanii]RAJ04134.1 hypothetical protein LX64_03012 [Chitinophaga skermanii]